MTDESAHRAAPDDDEYAQMLLLEDLESLAEEMDEVGVTDVAEVRRWLSGDTTDPQAGVPGAADRAGLEAIARMMADLGVTSRAELATRIRTMQEQMDWGEEC
jgi:hypothetical protein